MPREAYICDFARTPIARYGGGLKDVRADDLAAHPIRTLMKRHTQADWASLDDVILGCANQAGEDGRNVARIAALLAGLPEPVPGATVNRLCGSGLDAAAMAARAVKTGEADFVIAGGVESMTRAPYVMGKAGQAFARDAKIYDTTIGWRFTNPLIESSFGADTMPETAENLAASHGIARADQDAFALRSQQRAAAARRERYFEREIAAEGLPLAQDEHPRPNVTPEQLAKLAPIMRADGTVTAGNASGVNDGAAALIIASEEAARRNGLTPRARFVAAATAGVAPRIMGIGPVPATRKLLDRAGIALGDIDIIELNEAFAAQALAVMRDLGLAYDAPHVNPHGGAIALGHPLGMSGARLAMTAVNALETAGGKRALVTMCIGVGQGIAALIERV